MKNCYQLGGDKLDFTGSVLVKFWKHKSFQVSGRHQEMEIIPHVGLKVFIFICSNGDHPVDLPTAHLACPQEERVEIKMVVASSQPFL